jgi:hypothetical protein
MNDGMAIVHEILKQASQLEREKQGKALTEDEVKVIQAAAFLRRILPPEFQ